MIVIVSKQADTATKRQSVINGLLPVEVTQNWLTAAALLKNSPVRLLIIDTDELLDEEIPTISWIKTHNPQLPILILGDEDMLDGQHNALNEGAQGYCTKTADEQEFKHIVKTLLTSDAN